MYARLYLLKAVEAVLHRALRLLGITPINHMWHSSQLRVCILDLSILPCLTHLFQSFTQPEPYITSVAPARTSYKTMTFLINTKTFMCFQYILLKTVRGIDPCGTGETCPRNNYEGGTSMVMSPQYFWVYFSNNSNNCCLLLPPLILWDRHPCSSPFCSCSTSILWHHWSFHSAAQKPEMKCHITVAAKGWNCRQHALWP